MRTGSARFHPSPPSRPRPAPHPARGRGFRGVSTPNPESWIHELRNVALALTYGKISGADASARIYTVADQIKAAHEGAAGEQVEAERSTP